MSIGTLNLTSVLYTAYGQKQGSNTIASLLGSDKTTALSTQNTLLSSLSGKTTSDSSLAQFVKNNIPNNDSILKDVYAVEALARLFSDELPKTSAFTNAYQQTLIQGQLNSDNGASALSLLL